MKFRTEITIEESKSKIGYNNKILTIGSCFAQNIGEYFERYRFNILCNPFGILYNPVSVYNSIKHAVEKTEFTKADLVENQGEWHSFYYHSDFSHHDQNICLDNLNKSTNATNKFLRNADMIIITYGTSYVYKHREENIIVSNCHKLPQSEFELYRLSFESTTKAIRQTIELLRSVNKNIKIVFTVSPVRHWKDGAINNQLSKSNLLLAINSLSCENKDCLYFPSYEIVMDDLRDYRFYAEDLLHPNQIATDYIWKKFSDSIIFEEDKSIMKDIAQIVKAREHKVRNPHSQKHQEFLTSQIKKISELKKKHPHIDLENDKEYFENQKI